MVVFFMSSPLSLNTAALWTCITLPLVKIYSGKGEIKYDRKGQWIQQETIVTNDKLVGVVFNNQTGKSVATSVFKIHYGKDGVHIVPDYPSKKR